MNTQIYYCDPYGAKKEIITRRRTTLCSKVLTLNHSPPKKKIWLASTLMHGDELRYVTEAYKTNWMSTVGENINEVEKIAAEKAEVKYAVGLSAYTAAFHLCVKLAGEKLYGKLAISHGAVEGKRVIAV